jgi:LuxR family maltose regulon positive regulatory protein
MTPLLTTKLHMPSPPAKLLKRGQLVRRLNAGLQSGHQVFLVSAPPGFGKTTCVCEWILSLQDWPASWLSLDTSDDDPLQFFMYFLAALQKIDQSIGRKIEPVLLAGELPPVNIITTTLINDIQESAGKSLIVLDDFQVIQDSIILQVLEMLLQNMPQSMHLVLISREDPVLPLSRLRANNRLTELRAMDLRLSRDEAGCLLNDITGLAISDKDVAMLDEKTEGWIAGLQLAAIAMQPIKSGIETEGFSNFISQLSGSHRYILSYLTEQVLSRQSEETRDFLLDTSILDRMSPDLCDAVTGRSDSGIQLRRLDEANLFIVPLDESQKWYRYHNLFADLLRDLQKSHHPERIAELHRRASKWYAQNNMVNESMKHALAAKDYAMAVDLLEENAMKMIMQGYVRTVSIWVQAMPAEWRTQSPRTYLALAWMHLLRGTYVQASPYLEQLEAIFSNPQMNGLEKGSIQAEWLVMQSLLLNKEGRNEEGFNLAEKAIGMVPKDHHRVLSLAYFGLACAYQAMDDYTGTVKAYQKSIQHSRSTEYTIAGPLSISSLSAIAFEHGQLHMAFEIAEPACIQMQKSGSLPPIGTVFFGMLGEVYSEWFDLDQARYYAQNAVDLSTLGGYGSGMIGTKAILARIALLEGDFRSALAQINEAINLIHIDTPDYVKQEAISQQVRVYLANQRLNAAQMALQSYGFSFSQDFVFPELPEHRDVPYSIGLLYNSSLFILIYRARNRHDHSKLASGIEFANRVFEGAQSGRYLPIALESLLLRAQMKALMGNKEGSQADYLLALELGAPEGFIGIFVEQGLAGAEALADLLRNDLIDGARRPYTSRILSAFTTSQFMGILQQDDLSLDFTEADAVEHLIEPLTERELDVLKLIASGLKYREIAEKLFISQNTVRFHIKSIYSKLNVNNRTQAIQAARRLRIL